MERTLVLLKPDAVQRALLGDIISRIERKGLTLIGCKMLMLTEELLAEHYSHLTEQSFYPEIASFMARTPVIALCVEGVDAIPTMRRLCGPTLAREAEPGTIRGDWAMSVQANLVHASDSPETAKAEIERFFQTEELFPYERILVGYIYSSREQSM